MTFRGLNVTQKQIARIGSLETAGNLRRDYTVNMDDEGFIEATNRTKSGYMVYVIDRKGKIVDEFGGANQ